MSDLVGNPEDRFSHNEAQNPAPGQCLLFTFLCFVNIVFLKYGKSGGVADGKKFCFFFLLKLWT